MQKNKTLDQIADELEESIEIIQPMYDIVKKYAPEYDVDAITTVSYTHLRAHET